MHLNMEESKSKAERSSVLMNTQELSEEAMFLAELRQLAGMDEQAPQEAPAPAVQVDESATVGVRGVKNPAAAAPQRSQLTMREEKPDARRPQEQKPAPQQEEKPARERRTDAAQKKAPAEGAWKGYLMVALSSIVLFATIAGVIIGLHTPF